MQLFSLSLVHCNCSLHMHKPPVWVRHYMFPSIFHSLRHAPLSYANSERKKERKGKRNGAISTHFFHLSLSLTSIFPPARGGNSFSRTVTAAFSHYFWRPLFCKKKERNVVVIIIEVGNTGQSSNCLASLCLRGVFFSVSHMWEN